MTLTPDDIDQITFKREMRGYAEEEVDRFLDQVLETVTELLQERDDFRTRLEQIEVRASEAMDAEALLRRTFAAAQRTADEAVEEARRQAEAAVAEARAHADELVTSAREESERLVEDSHRRLVEEQERTRALAERTTAAMEELRQFRASYLEQLRAVIGEHLAMIGRVGALPDLPDELDVLAAQLREESEADEPEPEGVGNPQAPAR